MCKTVFDHALDNAVKEFGPEFMEELKRPVNGIGLLERILLGFLQANDAVSWKEKFDRLDVAMEALTGEMSKARDSIPLSIMAQWKAMERWKGGGKESSDRSLARRASKFAPEHWKHGAFERLRKEFPLQEAELVAQAFDERLIQVGFLQKLALEEFEHRLALFGVPFQPEV